MTTLTEVKMQWRANNAIGWIGLAAAPTFALMALITAVDAPRIALCVSGMPPTDGMAWMYLLMSLFHLSPWLRLAYPSPKTEGS